MCVLGFFKRVLPESGLGWLFFSERRRRKEGSLGGEKKEEKRKGDVERLSLDVCSSRFPCLYSVDETRDDGRRRRKLLTYLHRDIPLV